MPRHLSIIIAVLTLASLCLDGKKLAAHAESEPVITDPGINSCCFITDDQLLVGTKDGCCYTLDLPSRKLGKSHKLTDESLWVHGLLNGQLIVSSGSKVLLVSLKDWKTVKTLSWDEPVERVAISNATNRLVVFRKGGIVSFVNQQSGDIIDNRCKDWSDSSRLTDMNVTSDGKNVLLVGCGFRDKHDRRLLAYSCETGKLLHDATGIATTPRCMLFSATFDAEDYVFCTVGEKELLRYNIRTNEKKLLGELSGEAMYHIAIPSRRCLAVFTLADTIDFFDTASLKVLHSVKIRKGGLWQICLSQTETKVAFVVFGGKTGYLYILTPFI